MQQQTFSIKEVHKQAQSQITDKIVILVWPQPETLQQCVFVTKTMNLEPFHHHLYLHHHNGTMRD